MIFVTVGTHEQPFNRLIKAVDDLIENGTIKEEVIIQKGYSTYVPKHCKYFDMLPWEEMQKYNKEARIIITHGGPASFIDILALGKTPIVVPRQAKYNEHVNDHQLEFARELLKKNVEIIIIEEIKTLGHVISEYETAKVNFISNNKFFVNYIENEIRNLFEKERK